MPPIIERPVVFEPLDPDDQTPGYLEGGEPLTADHLLYEGEPPDPTKHRVAKITHRVGGPVRKRTIGVPDAGSTPTQQRKGRLLTVVDDRNDRRVQIYDPNRHQADHAPELTYNQARRLIGETDNEYADRRSFKNALKKRHTFPWAKTPPQPTPEDRTRVLAQGGFGSRVLQERFQRMTEALDAQSQDTKSPEEENDKNPFDDISF